MSLSLRLKVWWPGMGFTCKKCGAYCDGENFFVNGQKMVRWCDECGYLEEGRKDSHTDASYISLLLLPPENSDFLLLNPALSRRRNMPH